MPPRASGLPARLVRGPALRAQSDRRLVRLVREGYESAFEEIVRRYRRPLDRFAASIVGGRSEDVTQDSFRKALVALRRDEGEVELRPWLYRIVRNTALNDLRDRPPAAAELAEGLIAGGRSAAAEAEERAEVAALTARLRALPDSQRAALVMRELEGMSHAEIAAALGISGGAARQAIARGRAAVRAGFGALVPLPLLRSPARAGDAGTQAAIGAGSAAAGAGALKLGLATVMVAGSIGAGVAIDHRGGHGDGPPSGRTRAVAVAPVHPGTEGSGATLSPAAAERAAAAAIGGSSRREDVGDQAGLDRDGRARTGDVAVEEDRAVRSGPRVDSAGGGSSDGAVDPGSDRDGSGRGGSRRGGPDDGSGHGGSSDDGSRHGGSGDGSAGGASGREGPGDGGSDRDGSGTRRSGREGSGDGTSGLDGPGDGGSGSGGSGGQGSSDAESLSGDGGGLSGGGDSSGDGSSLSGGGDSSSGASGPTDGGGSDDPLEGIVETAPVETLSAESSSSGGPGPSSSSSSGGFVADEPEISP
jgi:RNA polymerase sigma factor (sigma-70 family)